LLSACSNPSPPAETSPKPAPASSAAPTLGQVSGSAPVGDLVVVALEPKGEQSFPPQIAPPAMDQIGQTFSPAVLIVRTGQPTEFRNSDDTLHNVNVRNEDTKEQAFNTAIPAGEKFVYAFKKDGLYHVGCDIHPAMSAEIIASSSPFVTIAANDGSFSFA